MSDLTEFTAIVECSHHKRHMAIFLLHQDSLCRASQYHKEACALVPLIEDHLALLISL